MDFTEKAKQLVTERYLSSPEGVREVQQMQEYLEKENAMIDIGIQIMNLLPASSNPDTIHNSLWIRAQRIGRHLYWLFDLTYKQKDSLVEGIVKGMSPVTKADLPDYYDDDLPF